jgi:DNA-binding SARP family transcriptional activator
MAMPQLALHFLGSPYLLLNDEGVTLSHQKAVALLAYLAVTHQRFTRTALADLFWPDYSASDARAGVRRMIWVINNSLGRDWLETDQQTVPPQRRTDATTRS